MVFHAADDINPEKYSHSQWEKFREYETLEELLGYVREIQEGEACGTSFGPWLLRYTGAERDNGKKEVIFSIYWNTLGLTFPDILRRIPDNAGICFQELVSARYPEEDDLVYELLNNLPLLTVSLSFTSAWEYEVYFKRDYSTVFVSPHTFTIKLLKYSDETEILKKAKDHLVPLKKVDENTLEPSREAYEVRRTLRGRKIKILKKDIMKNILSLSTELFNEAYEKTKRKEKTGWLVGTIYQLDNGKEIPPIEKISTPEIRDACMKAYEKCDGPPSYFEALWSGDYYEVEVENKAGHRSRIISITSTLQQIGKAIEEVLG